MTSIRWKEIIIKHKNVCNQLVLSEKRTNSKFSIEDVSNHIVPFFDSITSKNNIHFDETSILSLYEMYITLLSKQFLQQLDGITSLFYKTLEEAPSNLKQNPTLFLPFLTNTISKVENSKKELFLNRLLMLLPFLQSIEELTVILGLLFWASGKPEYRETIHTKFQTLRVDLKADIKRILGIEEPSIETAFVNQVAGDKKNTSIHFRIIPGHPLFGGNFSQIPVLYRAFDAIYVASGKRWFQLFADEFGTSLYPSEQSLSGISPSQIQTNFWKEILQKKFDSDSIASAVEKDSFVIFSLKHSYQLYLFYIGRS